MSGCRQELEMSPLFSALSASFRGQRSRAAAEAIVRVFTVGAPVPSWPHAERRSASLLACPGRRIHFSLDSTFAFGA